MRLRVALCRFWRSVFSFIYSSVTLSDCLTSLVFDHQGRVECWDPRVRNRVGMLDCALSSLTEGTEYVPSCHIEMPSGFSWRQSVDACAATWHFSTLPEKQAATCTSLCYTVHSIYLINSYPAPLFHHFCLCVHFTSTIISWSHVILICVFVDRVQGLPSVSALKFNGSLTMAVGTSTGQVSQKLFV